jgi:hypothetical protein
MLGADEACIQLVSCKVLQTMTPALQGATRSQLAASAIRELEEHTAETDHQCSLQRANTGQGQMIAGIALRCRQPLQAQVH